MEIKNKIKSIAIKSILLLTLITVFSAANTFASDNNDTGSDYSSSEETTADTIAPNSIIDNQSLLFFLVNGLCKNDYDVSKIEITGLKASDGSLILNTSDLAKALGIDYEYSQLQISGEVLKIINSNINTIKTGEISFKNSKDYTFYSNTNNYLLEMATKRDNYIGSEFVKSFYASQAKILTTGLKITFSVGPISDIKNKSFKLINKYTTPNPPEGATNIISEYQIPDIKYPLLIHEPIIN